MLPDRLPLHVTADDVHVWVQATDGQWATADYGAQPEFYVGTDYGAAYGMGVGGGSSGSGGEFGSALGGDNVADWGGTVS